MRTSIWAFPSVVALALSAGACAGGYAPLALRSSTADARTAPELAGTDGEFTRLAGEIPGFAGYWRDRDGRLTIALTDVSQRDLATDVLTQRLRRDDRGSAAALEARVVHADYDFARLAAWHAQASAVLGIRGVVFTDADETANRIRIGISDASREAAVRAELARLGVPAVTVIVERAAPVELILALS